ncbi:thrombospondin type-1 domain-containing protein 4-like [Physella acuta]|uniref:thrombospondin type-1 domain-containing protein 4-like n=1 Tax=Physella acuta TaxID=109671 RepID=UPI0027DE3A05|nr:thrombospondin type-1 domain-containing protein 4-like [Physella acuta]
MFFPISHRNANNGIGCVGLNSQIKVCHTTECSGDQQTSRQAACAQYSIRASSGISYTWEPAVHPTDPCRLSCRAIGHNFLANPPGRVEDGESCGDLYSTAVCIKGVCQAVGCDGIVMSSAYKDKCGVCEGDGTSCSTISGIFTSTELKRGLNYVISIPTGSTNINITELQGSRNTLVLQTEDGTMIINGGSGNTNTGDVIAAGSVFLYGAKSHTKPMESILSPGPTNTTLILQLMLKDYNPGIFYTFNVPNNISDTVLRQIKHRQQPIQVSPDSSLNLESRSGGSSLHPRPVTHGNMTARNYNTTDDVSFLEESDANVTNNSSRQSWPNPENGTSSEANSVVKPFVQGQDSGEPSKVLADRQYQDSAESRVRVPAVAARAGRYHIPRYSQSFNFNFTAPRLRPQRRYQNSSQPHATRQTAPQLIREERPRQSLTLSRQEARDPQTLGDSAHADTRDKTSSRYREFSAAGETSSRGEMTSALESSHNADSERRRQLKERQEVERQRRLRERQLQLEARQRRRDEQTRRYNERLREHNERIRRIEAEREAAREAARRKAQQHSQAVNQPGETSARRTETSQTHNVVVAEDGVAATPRPDQYPYNSRYANTEDNGQTGHDPASSRLGEGSSRPDRTGSESLNHRHQELVGNQERHVVRVIQRPVAQGPRYIPVEPSPPLSALTGNGAESDSPTSTIALDKEPSNPIPPGYLQSVNDLIPNNVLPNQINYFGGGHEHVALSSAYEWRISGLTECTHTCGGGIQQTVVVCIDIKSQAVVTDENCRTLTKPKNLAVPCNKRPCPSEWTPGHWTTCTVTCGQGVQTRIITCQARVSPTLNVTMPDANCESQVKPVNRQTCNDNPCSIWRTGDWTSGTGDWTSCSAGCGVGQRTRTVECVDTTGKPQPDNLCTEPKPAEEDKCHLAECGKGWYFTEWPEECPVECGVGTVSRRTFCADDAGNALPDARCDNVHRPAVNKSCRASKPCGGIWFTGQWSKCNTTCGNGHKKRDVLCIKSLPGGVFAVVGEENCDVTVKPAGTELCQGPECGSLWYMTSWGQCSQSCETGYRTRETKCLDAEQKPSDQCPLQSRPRTRDPCNTQPCTSTATPSAVNGTVTEDAICEDKLTNCNVVKKAPRVCSTAYYKKRCCRSCAVHS